MERPYHQAELKLLPGAEPWILVRHRKGSFKLPLIATCEELLQGVTEGWGARPRLSAAC